MALMQSKLPISSVNQGSGPSTNLNMVPNLRQKPSFDFSFSQPTVAGSTPDYNNSAATTTTSGQRLTRDSAYTMFRKHPSPDKNINKLYSQPVQPLNPSLRVDSVRISPPASPEVSSESGEQVTDNIHSMKNNTTTTTPTKSTNNTNGLKISLDGSNSNHMYSTTSLATTSLDTHHEQEQEPLAKSSEEYDLSVDFPYLRATHSFNAEALFKRHNLDESSSVCLSFDESDIAILHSVHTSGWGDATLLSSGLRGWVPTNYFVPYVEPQAIPLLAATLTFIINPKSYRIYGSNDYTFSQSSISNIVAGVKSLLEMCCTLTRQSPIVQRSPSVRKFRKSLLTELAILVSQAKENRNSLDDNVIDSLVHCCYQIVSKAVVYLDVWSIETNAKNPLGNSSTGGSGNSTRSTTSSVSSSEETHTTASVASSCSSSAVSPGKQIYGLGLLRQGLASLSTSPKKVAGGPGFRESVIFHTEPPMASFRLEEVNDALNAYLSLFIHRTGDLETDASASSQILLNTRKSMLACREILAVIEVVSSLAPTRNNELEYSKDRLYTQIRSLVSVAREAANELLSTSTSTTPTTGSHAHLDSLKNLSTIAKDCSRCSNECVVRCRNIINKYNDVRLPPTREYPDFSDGMIAVSKTHKSQGSQGSQDSTGSVGSSSYVSTTVDNRTSGSSYQSGATTEDEKSHVTSPPSPPSTHDDPERTRVKSLLPSIPLFSPLVQTSGTTSTTSVLLNNQEDDFEQVVFDTKGNLRVATLEALVSMLVDESSDGQRIAFMTSWFFLTFRTFATSNEVLDVLVQRYETHLNHLDVDENQIEMFTLRRQKIFGFIRRWMESHWIQSIDGPSLPRIMQLADQYFSRVVPNGDHIIHNLALELTSGKLADGEPIVKRLVDLPNEDEFNAKRLPSVLGSPSTYGSSATSRKNSNTIVTNLNRSTANLLLKYCESNNFTSTSETPDDSGRSVRSMATWASSLRKGSFAASNISLVSGNNSTDNANGFSILDIDAADLAFQLTSIDSELFCSIQPNELIDQNFSLKKRNLGLAPHVANIFAYANDLNAFVSDTILGGDINPKVRRNLLKHWIKTAEKCNELGNFNTMLSIVSALQSVNILRLRKIWDMLPAKHVNTFHTLKNIMVPEKNFSAYRAQLKTRPLPVVPYLGLFLTDLTFVEEGNPKYRKWPESIDAAKLEKMPKLVNLDRGERLARIIGELQRYQVSYPISPCRELQFWLRSEMTKSHDRVKKDQQELWRRSCMIEPKN